MNLEDLTSDQGEGEIAIGFHFDEEGEVVVDGWRQSESGEFLQHELAEAYVLASQEQLRRESRTPDLIESYLQQRGPAWKMTDEFSSYLESTKQSWSQASKTSRTKGKNTETRCPNMKEAFLYRPGTYPVYKDVHRDHDPSQDVDLGQTFMNSEIEFAQSPDQGSSRSMKGSSQCNTRSVKDPWEALRGLAC